MHSSFSFYVQHVKTLIQLDNVVYPEMLGKMFVINVPSFVVATYDMIKGWLDVRTQKKIEFLGSGHVATARLLEFIDSGTFEALNCIRDLIRRFA